MPFIPHTEDECQAMLKTIGVERIEELFDEIPPELRSELPADIPAARPEMHVLADLANRAQRDDQVLCFAGAGCYDHHVPALIGDIAQRGELMTAYTPYQAEASQGTLQIIYEYQSMIAALTAMEVSNASVYDAGSGLAEACLMALRLQRRQATRRIALAGSLNPLYRSVLATVLHSQGVELVQLPVGEDGLLPAIALDELAEDCAALVLQQPNFFGQLEAVDALTDQAHARKMLVVATVNPISLGMLKPPGQWGQSGADIVVGDGQPLGIPMASGGPSFGFMCCRLRDVRQLPGRMVGRTRDLHGRTGYTLTLQAREQHIRRGRATSNICTNQGLLIAMSAMYMALMGSRGLARVAAHCHERSRKLAELLCQVPGFALRYPGPAFHEWVLTTPLPAGEVVEALARHRLLAGVPLSRFWPQRDHELLVCATEKRSDDELRYFADRLSALVGA